MLFVTAILAAAAIPGVVLAQDDAATAVGSQAADAVRQAAREKAFVEMMTGAELVGTWQMIVTEGPGPRKLTDPAPESYSIRKVEKTGDYWIITARIRYGGKDAEVPVLVKILWSGDTPIITVDNLAIPVFGTYSARVMVYGGFYAGTWFGKGYAGVLSGRIVHATDGNKSAENSDDASEKPRPKD